MNRLLAMLVLFASPGAWAGGVTASDVERALSGYENPRGAENLRQLGPGWEQALVAVVRSPETRPIIRPRAIAALAQVPGAATAALLRELLSQRASATDGVAIIEMKAAIRALGAVEGARAAPELARLLEHASPDVRAASAQAIVAAKLPGGPKVLAERLAREEDPIVRHALQAGLE